MQLDEVLAKPGQPVKAGQVLARLRTTDYRVKKSRAEATIREKMHEHQQLLAEGKATEAEIIAFCREHIAHFKCPAAVEFGDLPKTSTGKVQKFVLRDREWKGQAKRIN